MSTICEKCNNKDSIIEDYSSGELVCNKCGLVYAENMIADEYEKRTFESDDNEIKRVGPPERPDQLGQPGTTLIIIENGKKKIIKTYTKQTKIDKNHNRIYRLLSLSDVKENFIEQTKILYDKLAPKMNMQGRNLRHIIIALYYYACRKSNMAKGLKEVSKMFPSVTERQIKKAFNSIKSHIVEYDDEDELIQIEKNFIQSYIGGNIQKYDIKITSYKILENINKNSIFEGKNPNTIAGLSLLLSYKLFNDNSDNFEDFFSTFASRATLKKYFEEIKPYLDKIIPEEYHGSIESIKKSSI